MPTQTDTDLAALVLRVSLGTMYLAHSVLLKLMTFGLDGTAGFFVGVGLPAWLAYATFAGEAIGGMFLILGIQTRWVALALTPALLGAIIWVHGANGWVFTTENGGWEYPAFLIAASVVQFLLGDGAYALSRSSEIPNVKPASARISS
jgi:putative oxidoreductase